MTMNDCPERINISPVHRQKREDDFYLVDRAALPGKGVEYTRTDHVQTLIAEAVAAEREACAKIVYQDAAFRGAYGKAVAGRIRAGTPADAQAALEARDKRVRDEALREASIFDLIEEMKRRHNPPHTGLEKVDLSPTDDSKGP
jgi:hypothetical protein